MTRRSIDKYQWILFDADGTLFSFDDAAGLKKLLTNYGVNVTRGHIIKYQEKNKALWLQYQSGNIDAAALKKARFAEWSERLNVPADQLNQEFLNAMSSVSEPLMGTSELVKHLHCKVRMGIVTNGFTSLQADRLVRSGLSEYFEFVVVSDAVGVAKPQKKIFEKAMSLMGNVDPKKVLMVGDNLIADIGGGSQMGFDTCWIQNGQYVIDKTIQPTFIIKKISELKSLMLKEHLVAEKEFERADYV